MFSFLKKLLVFTFLFSLATTNQVQASEGGNWVSAMLIKCCSPITALYRRALSPQPKQPIPSSPLSFSKVNSANNEVAPNNDAASHILAGITIGAIVTGTFGGVAWWMHIKKKNEELARRGAEHAADIASKGEAIAGLHSDLDVLKREIQLRNESYQNTIRDHVYRLLGEKEEALRDKENRHNEELGRYETYWQGQVQLEVAQGAQALAQLRSDHQTALSTQHANLTASLQSAHDSRLRNEQNRIAQEKQAALDQQRQTLEAQLQAQEQRLQASIDQEKAQSAQREQAFAQERSALKQQLQTAFRWKKAIVHGWSIGHKVTTKSLVKKLTKDMSAAIKELRNENSIITDKYHSYVITEKEILQQLQQRVEEAEAQRNEAAAKLQSYLDVDDKFYSKLHMPRSKNA